jgi:hypothetical protein
MWRRGAEAGQCNRVSIHNDNIFVFIFTTRIGRRRWRKRRRRIILNPKLLLVIARMVLGDSLLREDKVVDALGVALQRRPLL